jgi:hypothetical protein
VQKLGLALMVVGEVMRKAAIVTARHNFTHMVQLTRRARHVLVTHGIYRHIRHPGYLGWLLWAVGTQLLLQNALCTVLFAAAVRSRAAPHVLRACLRSLQRTRVHSGSGVARPARYRLGASSSVGFPSRRNGSCNSLGVSTAHMLRGHALGSRESREVCVVRLCASRRFTRPPRWNCARLHPRHTE